MLGHAMLLGITLSHVVSATKPQCSQIIAFELRLMFVQEVHLLSYLYTLNNYYLNKVFILKSCTLVFLTAHDL